MMTSGFTALEKTALDEIASQYPAHRACLEAQFTAANVVSRENTGARFYTRFIVDRTAVPAVSCDRVIGQVWADIDGFNSPMTFLLFTTEGYANCLEGAAIDDSTTGIDFSAIKFKLIQP
ncbi:MAG: hypothetical protein WCC64_09640 [Aliidongia sp.]